MSRPKSMVEQAEEYLAYRRCLGYELKINGRQLLRFAKYADDADHQGPLTIDLALRWARHTKSGSRLTGARRLEDVRPFARYLSALDSRTEIPPMRLLSSGRRRVQPYIYAPREVRKLLRAARNLAPRNGMRARTFATFIGLMACAGLRTSEALKLARRDVDFERRLLTIRETKFRKSRLVPLHPSAADALLEYARFRDRHFPTATSGAFFVTQQGTSLRIGAVHYTFRKLRKRIGLRVPNGVQRVRLYDLRHSFATRTLLRWHREGISVDHSLPALSTYLGHGKVSDTYWYLTGIPELFAVTAAKFERYAHSPLEERS
jgi:integrase